MPQKLKTLRRVGGCKCVSLLPQQTRIKLKHSQLFLLAGENAPNSTLPTHRMTAGLVSLPALRLSKVRLREAHSLLRYVSIHAITGLGSSHSSAPCDPMLGRAIQDSKAKAPTPKAGSRITLPGNASHFSNHQRPTHDGNIVDQLKKARQFSGFQAAGDTITNTRLSMSATVSPALRPHQTNPVQPPQRGGSGRLASLQIFHKT